MFHVARRVVARRPHGVRFCTVKKARAVPKRTLVESKSRFPLKLVGLGLTTGLGVVFYRGDILPDGITNARLCIIACRSVEPKCLRDSSFALLMMSAVSTWLFICSFENTFNFVHHCLY